MLLCGGYYLFSLVTVLRRLQCSLSTVLFLPNASVSQVSAHLIDLGGSQAACRNQIGDKRQDNSFIWPGAVCFSAPLEGLVAPTVSFQFLPDLARLCFPTLSWFEMAWRAIAIRADALLDSTRKWDTLSSPLHLPRCIRTQSTTFGGLTTETREAAMSLTSDEAFELLGHRRCSQLLCWYLCNRRQMSGMESEMSLVAFLA